MAEYTLPELPYDYAALEPHISAHDHGAAPRQAPPGLCRPARTPRSRKLAEARDSGDFAQRQQAREGPRVQPRRPRQPLDLLDQPVARTAATSPTGELAVGDRRQLRLLRQVPARTSPRPRSASRAPAGPCWPGTPIGQKLIIQQFFDQQGNFAAGTVPLLLLDMWEHAFYLDYVNVQGRLRQGLLEHRQLGERADALRGRAREDRGPAGTVVADAASRRAAPPGRRRPPSDHHINRALAHRHISGEIP